MRIVKTLSLFSKLHIVFCHGIRNNLKYTQGIKVYIIIEIIVIFTWQILSIVVQVSFRKKKNSRWKTEIYCQPSWLKFKVYIIELGAHIDLFTVWHPSTHTCVLHVYVNRNNFSVVTQKSDVVRIFNAICRILAIAYAQALLLLGK